MKYNVTEKCEMSIEKERLTKKLQEGRREFLKKDLFVGVVKFYVSLAPISRDAYRLLFSVRYVSQYFF